MHAAILILIKGGSSHVHGSKPGLRRRRDLADHTGRRAFHQPAL